MSILIKGIEMPRGRPVCIVIDAAGQVRRYDLNNDRYADDKLFEAVPVPPHGRLIDANALARFLLDKYWDSSWISSSVLDRFVSEIANAPTIIPADHFGDATEMVKKEGET